MKAKILFLLFCLPALILQAQKPAKSKSEKQKAVQKEVVQPATKVAEQPKNAETKISQKGKTQKQKTIPKVEVQPVVQPDPVLLTVAGENITKSEFLRVYQKNNFKDQPMDEKSIREYLDLYINFKLKVKQAEDLKLDTIPSFKAELKSYRSQLTQPYMTDTSINTLLTKEAYDRMQFDVRASHILVKLDKSASPKDTLEAWNRIMKIRDRIIKGENFAKVAAETSDDPSAKDTTLNGRFYRGNGGDLGYFSVFDMIYPFENAAYTTKPGDVSAPVRTEFGYHLLKVVDKKKALGKVNIAHILFLYPQNFNAEDSVRIAFRANEVFAKLKTGASFEELAKEYSDDKSSASKGGVLPEYGVNRLLPEFVIAIEKLKNPGEVSDLFSSRFGFHILKLIERKPLQSFEDAKTELKGRVTRDVRAGQSQESFIARLKKEYAFVEHKAALKEFYKVVTDSVFQATWKVSQAEGMSKPLFTIANQTYDQKDFADYIAAKQNIINPEPIEGYVNRIYKDFVDRMITVYEDERLEEKYPDFRILMKEYRDGILLFDLTDQKVWSKAVKDTVGLKEFYNVHKNNYMWENRVEATIVKLNEKKANADKAKSIVEKSIRKNWPETELFKNLYKLTKDSTAISIHTDKYEKGDSKFVDASQWKQGLSYQTTENGQINFVIVRRTLTPEPKELKEAKGMITADYQNYLEKEWIKTLRSTYPFTVNEEELKAIFVK